MSYSKINEVDAEKVAEILLNIDAVSLNPFNPFKYASGIFSPIYTDCRLLSSYPSERRAIVNMLVDYVNNNIGHEIDTVVGTGTSAISLATYVSQKLKVPMAYVRHSEKDHGKRKQIEGTIKKGSRVLLVSDIMSTEPDIPVSVNVIKNVGGEVIYCLTIFSNNLGIVEDFLEKERIPFYYLTDLKKMLTCAIKKEKISADEKATVEEWMANPENWNELRQYRMSNILKKINRDIAKILLNLGCVTLSPDKPYKYTSGIYSPIYTDNRLLISYPTKWEYVINSFLNLIVNKIGTQNVDVIAGVATSGIPHAAYLAEKLGLPMIYIKTATDDYGKRTMIEGHLKRGDKVLIIEDHISTGSTLSSAVRVLREAGAIVDWCLAIFTYNLKKSIATFRRENITLETLSDLDAFLEVAVERGVINNSKKDVVLRWADDPDNWAKREEISI